jgi:hypothetical protein
MSVQDFDHFLLTRFNVRMEERASEEWLRHRLRYFEALCRTSVVSQTEPNFTWLVYFDAERDPWFQTEIDRLSEGAFEPIWVDGPMTSDRAPADIASRSDSPWIITTRVDNDDALARDFIAKVQAEFAHQDCQFINFQSGLQMSDEGGIYHLSIPSNPFMSLVEKRTEKLPLGVFVDWHNRVSKLGPLKQVATHPMWIQMVHGRNITNTIGGIRANPKLMKLFFDVDMNASPLGKLQLAASQITTAMSLGSRRVGHGARRLLQLNQRNVDQLM